MALLPGFIGLGGKSKRVQNVATGEVLSRRVYAEKIKRGGLITNEQLAQVNKSQDLIASISRPAKGRRSIQKLGPEFKKTVAQARIEAATGKAQREAREKLEKKANREFERLLGKQIVIVPKVTSRLLKAGDKGRRIAFNDYQDYLIIRAQAEKTGDILSMSVGVTGIDTRNPLNPIMISATVFTMLPIRQKRTEAEFNEGIKDFVESKSSYFMLLHFWTHLAFKTEAYERKAKAAGIKKSIVIKDRPARKRVIKPVTKPDIKPVSKPATKPAKSAKPSTKGKKAKD